MYFPLSSCESSSLFCFLARRAAGRRWKPSLNRRKSHDRRSRGEKKKKNTSAGRCVAIWPRQSWPCCADGECLCALASGAFFFPPLNRFIQFIEKKNKKNLSLFPSHASFLLRSPEFNPGRDRGRGSVGGGFKNVRARGFDVHVCVCVCPQSWTPRSGASCCAWSAWAAASTTSAWASRTC